MADLGFKLILYPLTGLFAAARALEAMYRKLRADGTTLGAEGRLKSFEAASILLEIGGARLHSDRTVSAVRAARHRRDPRSMTRTWAPSTTTSTGTASIPTRE